MLGLTVVPLNKNFLLVSTGCIPHRLDGWQIHLGILTDNGEAGNMLVRQAQLCLVLHSLGD